MRDEAPTPRPCRVVVADDNQDLADSLAILLQIEGHAVTVVNDGMSALETIETQRPEVALLDIGMPGLTGYEVACRAREALKERILLVAITGWGQQSDKDRAAAAGFDLHFTKPVEPDVLTSLLRAIPARGL